MQPVFVPVVESSQVFAARHAGHRLAANLGWAEEPTGKLSIILTEAATNLVKHAKQGELYLRPYPQSGEDGIEVLSLDHGPGVAKIEACMTDGYSTAGTAGTGLGAIFRLADEFDIYSQEGKGTSMVARLFPGNRKNEQSRPQRAIDLGCAVLAVQGETECGDDWGMRTSNGITTVLLADGLGHGPGAAEASRAAVAALDKAKDLTPASILDDVHLALRSTRGAAVAVAQIDLDGQQVRFAGVGNISGILLNGTAQQNMISHNGTVGHTVRKIQEFNYPWRKKTLMVLHSDGINTNWRLESYPGISGRDPSLLAALLLRDATRIRDDASVLVVREGG